MKSSHNKQVRVPNFTSILQMRPHINFQDEVCGLCRCYSMFVKLPEELTKPACCLALEVMFLICLDQERSAEMVSPKYLILSTKSTG